MTTETLKSTAITNEQVSWKKRSPKSRTSDIRLSLDEEPFHAEIEINGRKCIGFYNHWITYGYGPHNIAVLLNVSGENAFYGDGMVAQLLFDLSNLPIFPLS
jgi:hypothetical protein